MNEHIWLEEDMRAFERTIKNLTWDFLNIFNCAHTVKPLICSKSLFIFDPVAFGTRVPFSFHFSFLCLQFPIQFDITASNSAEENEIYLYSSRIFLLESLSHFNSTQLGEWMAYHKIYVKDKKTFSISLLWFKGVSS